MGLVFCRYCGKEIQDTVHVCPHCSALQQAIVARNGSAAKNNQPFIQCLTLFAVIYLALLFFAGLSRTLFSLDYDLNIPILFITIIIISNLLAKKVNRYITKTEIVKFSLGAGAIILVIRLGAILFLTRNLTLTTSWKFWILLLIDLIFLFVFFGYYPNKFFKAIEANEKETCDKSNIKKKRIVFAVLSIIGALILCDLFLSTFLANSTYSNMTAYIIIISTIVFTAYLNNLISLNLDDPKIQSRINPSFKKRWVRISGSFLMALILSFMLFGSSLPWLYTSIAGSEGELLVNVTGWHSGGRRSGCSCPEVDDQTLVPPRGLCVDRADKPKYPKGTTLRLKGKISTIGININTMEIVHAIQQPPL